MKTNQITLNRYKNNTLYDFYSLIDSTLRRFELLRAHLPIPNSSQLNVIGQKDPKTGHLIAGVDFDSPNVSAKISNDIRVFDEEDVIVLCIEAKVWNDHSSSSGIFYYELSGDGDITFYNKAKLEGTVPLWALYDSIVENIIFSDFDLKSLFNYLTEEIKLDQRERNLNQVLGLENEIGGNQNLSSTDVNDHRSELN